MIWEVKHSQFLKKEKLSKLIQEDIDKLNDRLSIKD